MRNIQVIDGARNCAYDIFAATDEEFALIFPAPGQDIQFIEDLYETQAHPSLDEAFERIWNRRQDKKSVHGINGTLFYELSWKREYYPNRRETDLDESGARRRL